MSRLDPCLLIIFVLARSQLLNPGKVRLMHLCGALFDFDRDLVIYVSSTVFGVGQFLNSHFLGYQELIVLQALGPFLRCVLHWLASNMGSHGCATLFAIGAPELGADLYFTVA